MSSTRKIRPCLWFDAEAEEAARFYASVFPNSTIGTIARYGEAGQEVHGRQPGSVMTIEFELDGQSFMGLNGGPVFRFNEAVSFMVECETQEQVDHYWEKLSEGGDEGAQQCGWLKDRFGLSWQIVPSGLSDLIGGPDRERSDRAMEAMLRMKKIDLDAVRRAYDGR
jgi:predicted 3-demethylubiquinone-9 3-methyltransferase (glyoxalase superfamily)